MEKRFDLLGIGIAVMDLLGTVPRYPEPDEKIYLDEVDYQGGGEVATALVAMTRLGGTAAIHSVVGDDYLGHRIREELHAEGVDVSGLVLAPGAKSPFAFCVAESEAQRRTIFFSPGTGRGVRKDEVPPERIAAARMIHLDGRYMTTAVYAARLACEQGVPVMLDGTRVRPGVEELIPLVDYLVVSERFAKEWSRSADPIKGLDLYNASTHRLVGVTLGAQGFVGVDAAGTFEIPAFHVDVVDTTGAGDVFHGALACALLRGWDHRKAARFASAAAALKCRSLGGRKGIPSFREACRFLCEHGENGFA